MYMYGIYTHAYTNIRIYIYRHTLVITIVRKQIKKHIVENAEKLCEPIVQHLSRSLL